jgi:ubiquinone/menaquinone biosynthesis C-methylase UbiE
MSLLGQDVNFSQWCPNMRSELKVKKNCESQTNAEEEQTHVGEETWQKWFDSQSETYGDDQHETERFVTNFEKQRILTRIFDEHPFFKSTLELGCGWGRYLSIVSRHSVTAVGLDLSKQMLITCKKRFRNLRIDLVQGDMKHLPFKSDAFDLVYSIRAFKYSLKPYTVLEETYRVSENDGFVLIYEKNTRASLKYLPDLLNSAFSARSPWHVGVSPFLMKKYYNAVGFNKISCEGVLFLPSAFYQAGKTKRALHIFSLLENVASKTPFLANLAGCIIYTGRV